MWRVCFLWAGSRDDDVACETRKRRAARAARDNDVACVRFPRGGRKANPQRLAARVGPANRAALRLDARFAYIHARTHAHTHTRAQTHAHTHAHKHAHTHTRTHAQAQAFITIAGPWPATCLGVPFQSLPEPSRAFQSLPEQTKLQPQRSALSFPLRVRLPQARPGVASQVVAVRAGPASAAVGKCLREAIPRAAAPGRAGTPEAIIGARPSHGRCRAAAFLRRHRNRKPAFATRDRNRKPGLL
jgi:hypothetical protein